MTLNLNILIVDDEQNIRKTLTMALEAEGYQVWAVATDEDALEENRATKFDLCFLDMRLGVTSGLDLLPKLLAASPWLKVVVITAHGSIDNAVHAMRSGAFDYIEKPFSTSEIYAAARKVETIVALESRIHQLEEEIARENPEIEFSSQCPLMQTVIELAKSAAPTQATVLITGENGTGKSMLAKTIHRWSSRKNRPFAVISCPSLSNELLESELFGHVKGAFTGALKNHPGWIATCDGGTLFLDEIGDMPFALQAKLLRFLQDREYEQIGDTVTRRADVRIVAATNVRLKEAVKGGRFREDLYYRLNVIQIAMPALRERKEDIPLIAATCLASLRANKKMSGFSESALERLKAYEWPGNIRELRNVIERAVIVCASETIEVQHLILDDGGTGTSDSALMTLDRASAR